MSDEIAKQIENDVRKLDEHFEFTGGIRKNVIAKLSAVVDSLDIKPNDEKASVIEAKMNVVNTLLGALNDSDRQKADLIKVKQRIKADETKEDDLKMITNTIAAYMRKIDTRLSIIDPANRTDQHSAETQLSEAVVTDGVEILEGELLFSTDLKTAKDIEV